MALQNQLKTIRQTFNGLTINQKKSIALVLLISIIIKILPLTNYLSQSFSLMAHELGHAVTAWCFRHFAVPRFDMLNGGGVTDIYPRSFIFSVIIFAIIAVNFIYLKKHAEAYTIKISVLFMIIFCLLFFTDLHYSLIAFMGKGGELLFCYLIAWYALFQLRFKIQPKAFFYLVISALLWVNSLQDSLKLIFNEEIQSKYLVGKEQTMGGNPLTNDLVKLSESSGLSLDFFNYLLLFISFYTIYKIAQLANRPAFSKARFFVFLQTLSVTLFNQTKHIKSQKYTHKSNKHNLKK